MKETIKIRAVLASLLAILSLAFATSSFAQQTQKAPVAASDRDAQAIADFEKGVKEYVTLREGLEDQMPKLSPQSTPEQIEAHLKAFREIVRKARAGAKPGSLFTPAIAQYIRRTIRSEYKGKDLLELRQTVMEAETKGVPLKVNFPYPQDKELLDMPPTLLLKLPKLPKQVKYRFVNRNMLLVDRENGLIVDYMRAALP
jgi:hypothetical protein